MLVTVLKAFPMAAANGLTVKTVQPGEQEVRDDLIDSLVADGYIERPEGHAPGPMTARRRDEIINRMVAKIRAEMAAADDQDLEAAERHLDRADAEARERAETLGEGITQGTCRICGEVDFLNADQRCLECYTERSSAEPPILYGSSDLPAHVQIGDKMVQLGGLVVAAHRASGLSADDWNEPPEDEREAALSTTLERLNGDLLAASIEIDPAAIVSTVEPTLAASPPAADPVADTAAAFDHDGDGKPGGSLPKTQRKAKAGA